MKSFSCGEVVPGCDARFRGRTDDEILGQVVPHAAAAHGMRTVPPQVAALVRSRILETP